MRSHPSRCVIFHTLLCGFLLICLGCGGGSSAPPPVIQPPLPPLDPLLVLENESEGAFATSLACELCHANSDQSTAMRDPQDRPVGMLDLWRASSMAASSRDPFWRAAVSAEVADNPDLQAEIEETCLTCHAPMALTVAHDQGEDIGMDILEQDTPRAHLAIDGVSCTLCHQVIEDNLGEDESYSGNFLVNDVAETYAEHEDPSVPLMQGASGYKAVAAKHMAESTVCATCHTLFTDTLDDESTPTGDIMPEQTAYLEWLNSVFNDELDVPGPEAAGCRDCHMPSRSPEDVEIETPISRSPGGGDLGPGMAPPRTSYDQHRLVGANTLLLEILRENADDLNPNADTAALQQAENEARRILAEETADLSVVTMTREGDLVRFVLRVDNRAGHKFPTGYPSRRAWLRVRVRNAAGALVFASGEHDAAGRLLDGAGRVHPSERQGGPILPHFTRIDDEDDVQVYQPIMQAPSGDVTWRLLRGSGYKKDNRLLPRGWSAQHEDAADTAPHGAAAADPDFRDGRDEILYEVGAPAAAGPYTLEADLLYQVLAPRYAEELFRVRTQETESFRRYYEDSDRTPALVANVAQALP